MGVRPTGRQAKPGSLGKEVVDVSLKFENGIQWVKVPPRQSLAGRRVASLALWRGNPCGEA